MSIGQDSGRHVPSLSETVLLPPQMPAGCVPRLQSLHLLSTFSGQSPDTVVDLQFPWHQISAQSMTTDGATEVFSALKGGRKTTSDSWENAVGCRFVRCELHQDGWERWVPMSWRQ